MSPIKPKPVGRGLAVAAAVILVLALTASAKLGVKPAYAVGMGALVLLIASERVKAWQVKCRRFLPPLIFVVLPILGYTKAFGPSPGQNLANLLAPAIAHTGWVALSAASCITFLISVSLVSANVSGSVAAPILLPLLLGLGIKPELAAAGVLVGTWGGVCSPASQNANFLASGVGGEPRSVIYNHLPAVLTGLAVCMMALSLEAWAYSGPRHLGLVHGVPGQWRLAVAILPLLPLAVFLLKPGVDLLWWRAIHALRPARSPARLSPESLKTTIDQAWRGLLSQPKMPLGAYIPAAMMVLSIVALCSASLPLHDVVVGFSRGVLDGARDVVLLVASILAFVDAFEAGKLTDQLLAAAGNGNSGMFAPLCCAITAAVATGSGDAAVTAINGSLLAQDQSLRIDRRSLGSLIWIGGEMGRCLSPVAAVTATIAHEATRVAGQANVRTNVDAFLIARLAALPIFLGLIGVCLALRGKILRNAEVNQQGNQSARK